MQRGARSEHPLKTHLLSIPPHCLASCFRMEELRRTAAMARSFGVAVEVISRDTEWLGFLRVS